MRSDFFEGDSGMLEEQEGSEVSRAVQSTLDTTDFNPCYNSTAQRYRRYERSDDVAKRA